MGLTNPCTHGPSNETLDNLKVRGVFNANACAGTGLDTGTFTSDADAATTVSDANVVASSQIVFSPTNGPAGLLLKSKSCFINTIAAGSFVFNVSASGAGAPAGTETFAYIVVNPTNLDE